MDIETKTVILGFLLMAIAALSACTTGVQQAQVCAFGARRAVCMSATGSTYTCNVCPGSVRGVDSEGAIK